MRQGFSRRRFLAIVAAAAALPRPSAARDPVARWRGAALGAPASMALVGVAQAEAGRIFAAVEREIARLEALFSLHRDDSLLARLNRAGSITAPPPDFTVLLDLAGTLHRTTAGAFDPTVQPLWLLHAAAAAEDRRPSRQEIAEIRRYCGWEHLRAEPAAVSFARPGMALTLNGIAQGFVADKVAALLRARGLRDVLVDMGEIAALGDRGDGTPWRADIASPEGRIVRQVRLSERALATSAPLGTLLDRRGRVGHIVDPRSGRAEARWQLVSVAAPSAALADGLSTAACLLSRDGIDKALAAHPDASLEALS